METFGRAGMAAEEDTKLPMRCASWLNRHALGICNNAFPQQQRLREQTSIVFYTYIVSLV